MFRLPLMRSVSITLKELQILFDGAGWGISEASKPWPELEKVYNDVKAILDEARKEDAQT